MHKTVWVVSLVGAAFAMACRPGPDAARGREVEESERRVSPAPDSAIALGKAEPSDLFLGLYDPASGYRTFWISGDGDTVAVRGSGPGLLIPRADGIWRVTQPDNCGYIAVGPTDGWPTSAVAHGRDWDGPLPERCPVGDGALDIWYAGSDYLAVRSHHGGGSRRAGGSSEYYVMSLDSLSQRKALPLRAFVSDSTLSQLTDMARASADSEQRRRRADCDWPVGSEPTGWAIVRDWGLWRLWARYQPSRGECGPIALTVPGSAPPQLVRHNELFPNWPIVRSTLLPLLQDAVSSPERGLVVALTRECLYVLGVDGKAVRRRPLAATAASGRIVMTEWVAAEAVRRGMPRLPELFAGATGDEAVDYCAIFMGGDWSNSQRFLSWAAPIPLQNAPPAPCADDTKRRLADSVADVLYCQRIGILNDGGALGAELVWAVVHGDGGPQSDCNAGLIYLAGDRIVGEHGATTCAYALPVKEPPAALLAAFRVHDGGEIGIVLDSDAQECAGRYALLVKEDHFEVIHTFSEDCDI